MAHYVQRLFASLLLGILFCVSILSTAAAIDQTPTPTPAPFTPTPDPLILVLQSVVATQQVEIQGLRRDLDYEVRDLRWWFIVAITIGAITGFTGYQAYRGIDKQIRRKIRVLINKHYYQLDVTNLPIHIRKGRNLERLVELLKNQGLYRFSWFEELGKSSFSGVTIVPIFDENDENEILHYMEQYYLKTQSLNPQKAGFILYAPTGYRISTKIIDMYPATAVANTPWNLVSTIMVIGRNITPPPKFDEMEDE